MERQIVNVFSEEIERLIADSVIKIVTRAENETKVKVNKRFYKKKEFCQEIGIANNTLTIWINKGLPVIQIEGITMIDMQDAIVFMNQHKI